MGELEPYPLAVLGGRSPQKGMGRDRRWVGGGKGGGRERERRRKEGLPPLGEILNTPLGRWICLCTECLKTLVSGTGRRGRQNKRWIDNVKEIYSKEEVIYDRQQNVLETGSN